MQPQPPSNGQNVPPQLQNPYQVPPPYAFQPAPMPPQPKKKKSRAKGCGIAAGIVLVVLIIAVIASPHGGANSTTGTTQGTAATQAPTSAAPVTLSVGQSTTVDNWKATVNSVTTGTGDDFITPKSGNVFLEIDVTVVNQTGKTQTFSSLLAFGLTDDTGLKYDDALTCGASSPAPDGNVSDGAPLRGIMCYSVPTSTKAFRLTFSPVLGSTDSAVWELSVK